MRPGRPLLLLLAAILSASSPATGGDGAVPVAPTPGEGYRLVDATAASVGGEVLFRSDVDREACMIRCGAFPGEAGRPVSFSAARRSLVEETAILQEQRRLSLGTVDNGALLEAAAKVRERLSLCPDPCAASVSEGAAFQFAWRRLLVRDFLTRRVSAFLEVTDEEVEEERGRLAVIRADHLAQDIENGRGKNVHSEPPQKNVFRRTLHPQ